MKLSIFYRRERIPWIAAVLMIVALSGYAIHAVETGSPTQIVKTSNGPIRGRVNNRRLYVFKGVRYGAPPIGDFRFKPPRKPEPWTEVADAYQYGARAIQAAGEPSAESATPGMSEDCLFLNIWTPGIDSKKRPVMVWLHGGGFSSGSGGDAITEGGNLARKGDVVVVSINHRLNVFGYLQLSKEWGPAYASRSMVGSGPNPQKVADQMSAAWIAFAQSGNPNVKGLPQWNPYDLKNRATMIFNLDSHLQNDPYSEIRRILLDSVK